MGRSMLDELWVLYKGQVWYTVASHRLPWGVFIPPHRVISNAVLFKNIVWELRVLARLFITNIADYVLSVTGARCLGVKSRVNGKQVT